MLRDAQKLDQTSSSKSHSQNRGSIRSDSGDYPIQTTPDFIAAGFALYYPNGMFSLSIIRL